MSIRTKVFKFFFTSLLLLAMPVVSGYDNTKFPDFELEIPNREYEFLSIHPNGEDLLISEGGKNSGLLLFNLKKRSLFKYNISGNYQYTFSIFSSSGEKIVMVRRSLSKSRLIKDQLEALRTSEIAIMNNDGSNFEVLPIPQDMIVALAMSKDEKKIAYWFAKTVRGPGSQTFISDFDIKELDLTTKRERLFAGPFNFFEIGSINYLNESTLLISGFAPRDINTSIQDYAKKFNYSHIYRIQRDQKETPTPIFTKNRNARNPVIDNHKNTYFVDYPETMGRAISKISHDGQYLFSWRMPDLKNYSFYRLAVSPEGRYLAFTYGNQKSAIGFFDFKSEIWTTIPIPPASQASIIDIKPVR